MELTCDLDLLQNFVDSFLAYAFRCHRVSWKLVWYVIRNPAYRPTNTGNTVIIVNDASIWIFVHWNNSRFVRIMYCLASCLFEWLDLNRVLNLSDFHLLCSFSTLIATGVFERLKESRWHIEESAFKLAGGPIILFPAIRQHALSSSSYSRASANMFSLSFSSRMSQSRPASHFPDFSVNLTMTLPKKKPYQCLALTPDNLD